MERTHQSLEKRELVAVDEETCSSLQAQSGDLCETADTWKLSATAGSQAAATTCVRISFVFATLRPLSFVGGGSFVCEGRNHLEGPRPEPQLGPIDPL